MPVCTLQKCWMAPLEISVSIPCLKKTFITIKCVRHGFVWLCWSILRCPVLHADHTERGIITPTPCWHNDFPLNLEHYKNISQFFALLEQHLTLRWIRSILTSKNRLATSGIWVYKPLHSKITLFCPLRIHLTLQCHYQSFGMKDASFLHTNHPSSLGIREISRI